MTVGQEEHDRRAGRGIEHAASCERNCQASRPSHVIREGFVPEQRNVNSQRGTGRSIHRHVEDKGPLRLRVEFDVLALDAEIQNTAYPHGIWSGHRVTGDIPVPVKRWPSLDRSVESENHRFDISVRRACE